MAIVETIYLVRYGHLDVRDPTGPTDGKDLLPVGVRQAERTARRLRGAERRGAPSA